jgi:cytochrome c oxidase assembly protein subunit 15
VADASPTPRPVGRGFARLSVVAAVWSLLVVALGGAVRATESGLACPTWPGCFYAGDFVPPGDLNVWLEHTHRLLAGGVGLLIAAQLVWALARHRRRPRILWPVVGAAVAVNAQALLGALVVWNLLRAELVTAHLGLGLAVVGLLLFVAVEVTGVRAGAVDRSLARTSMWVTAVTYVQILVGGHVSGVGTGLAYVDGPLLGVATLGPIASEGEFFNVAHRVLALAVLVAVGVLVRRARAAGATGWLLRLPHLAAGLVGLQVLIGVANLYSGLSFLAVIPHLAVASWIWSALVLTTTLAAGAARRGDLAPAPDSPTRELARSGG